MVPESGWLEAVLSVFVSGRVTAGPKCHTYSTIIKKMDLLHRQFQGTIISMVFDSQGIGFGFLRRGCYRVILRCTLK